MEPDPPGIIVPVNIHRDEFDMVDRVHQVAKDIFEACGAVDDFCHQTGLVFGGTNRIILTVHGWEAIRDYCTPRFLAAFDEYMTGS